MFPRRLLFHLRLLVLLRRTAAAVCFRHRIEIYKLSYVAHPLLVLCTRPGIELALPNAPPIAHLPNRTSPTCSRTSPLSPNSASKSLPSSNSPFSPHFSGRPGRSSPSDAVPNPHPAYNEVDLYALSESFTRVRLTYPFAYVYSAAVPSATAAPPMFKDSDRPAPKASDPPVLIDTPLLMTRTPRPF
ncbi:uncharacterized protein SCHCODRAFT_02487455 [Schizophyllum commune H4-8]|uniref:uncharacterized protein n=1 Tax=Schizophyllum commune (strain H4-8 / FGSC 9210) TaxID=578458 RepID=UPI0021603DCF|nr:uncharacterized protein SCHCODRAFT_02487455 [Schizophyllum commune H4-8]KAI5897538.1 hypothetical protein SCHCODRAFT_02487455 [Schizophyllum commune H4-8]